MVERRISESREACPPCLALERAARGEIEGSASDRWIAHIEKCDECKAEIERLGMLRRRFEGDPRREEILDRLRKMENTAGARILGKKRWIKGGLLAAAVALAACLAVVFVPWRPRTPDPAFVSKGGSALVATVLRAGRGFEYSGGDLQVGDTVQFSFIAGSAGYLSVWALESGARPVPVFPGDSSEAVRIEANSTVAAGEGLMVDRTTRDTVFAAVLLAEPYMLDDVAGRITSNPGSIGDLFPDRVFTLDVSVVGSKLE